MISVFEVLLRRGYLEKWLDKLGKYGKCKKTKHLKSTFAKLAASLVECDLRLNVLLTKQQAFLLLDTVTASLFIHIAGPLDLFVPAKYIKIIALNKVDGKFQDRQHATRYEPFD